MQQVGVIVGMLATEPTVRAPAATPITEAFAGLLWAHMGELGPPRDVGLESDVGEGSPDLAADSEDQPAYSGGFAVVPQWTVPPWVSPEAPGLVDPRLLPVADLGNAPRAAADSRATTPWAPQLARLAQVDASLGDGGDRSLAEMDTGVRVPFDPDASSPSLLSTSTVNEDEPSMARDATLVSPPRGAPVSRVQGSAPDPAPGSPQTPITGSAVSLAVEVEGREERAPAEIAPGLDQALGMVKTAALAAVAAAPEGRPASGADTPAAGKEGVLGAGVSGRTEDAEAWSDQRPATARADAGIATPMRTVAPSVADAPGDDHEAPDARVSAPSQAESLEGPGAALDPFGGGARNPGDGPAVPYAAETTSAQTGLVGLSDVSTEVRSLVIAGGREAHLRLEPESLGPVNVSVKYEGGQVSIDISVETAAARETLHAALPHLRASLEEENLPVVQLNLSGGSAWDLAAGGGEQRGGQQQQAFVASFTGWEEAAFAPTRSDGEGPSRQGLPGPLGQSVDRRV